jgi:hypothetical protein
VKSGKVIGIASYLPRSYEGFGGDPKSSAADAVRRFGYRIDKVPAWEPANWPELGAEADQIEQISKFTEDMFNLFESVYNQRDPHFMTERLRGPAMEWQAKLHQKQLSEHDRGNATQTLLTALHFLMRSDVSPIEGRLRYAYFRDQLASEQKVRDRLYKAFADQFASAIQKTH